MSSLSQSPNNWGGNTLRGGVLTIHELSTPTQALSILLALEDECYNQNGNFKVTSVVVNNAWLALMVWSSVVNSPLRFHVRTFTVYGVDADSRFAICPQNQAICDHIKVVHRAIKQLEK